LSSPPGLAPGDDLVYKDLDIDLTSEGRLRVRCKVGIGGELFGAIVMLVQLGEFEGQYTFALAEARG
jgi:hypothetical protein